MKLGIIGGIALCTTALSTLPVMAQMPEMQHVATAAQFALTSTRPQVSLVVSNPNGHAMTDAPVCVVLPQGCSYKSATVTTGGKEIPSQIDDLDGDGVKDELTFVIDLKKKGKQTVKVQFATTEAAADRYPERVHVQMFFADKDKKHKVKQHIPTDTVSEVIDNMYSKMHHHGPAFESELVAYRIYFDKKETTDLYGKKSKGLELAESLWYPTDEQLERGFGDDILRVNSTVGVGTLRGWNDDNTAKPMVMIDPFQWRQAHIVAKGPVRTVVDMNVQGWQYKGRSLNLKSRYILYAGGRECQVIQQFEGDTKGLEFVTGVMKVGADPLYTSNAATGMAASYGIDWPVNDTVKYAKQTCGLAVSIPTSYTTRLIDHKEQLLYGLKTNADNAILYKMSFCAPDKETFGPKSSDEWFALVDEWQKTLPAVVKAK